MKSPASVLATIDALSRREARLVAASRGEELPVESQPGKVTALVDAARALDGDGIPYALIGGLAVGVHAQTPRATLDPSGEPVQVAFDAGFDPMIARAESIDVGGVRVRIVGRDDLVAMKERAAADPARRKSKRLRDQADVELLRGDVPDPDEGW